MNMDQIGFNPDLNIDIRKEILVTPTNIVEMIGTMYANRCSEVGLGRHIHNNDRLQKQQGCPNLVQLLTQCQAVVYSNQK
jgi:hypothetical protein